MRWLRRSLLLCVVSPLRLWLDLIGLQTAALKAADSSDDDSMSEDEPRKARKAGEDDSESEGAPHTFFMRLALT